MIHAEGPLLTVDVGESDDLLVVHVTDEAAAFEEVPGLAQGRWRRSTGA